MKTIPAIFTSHRRRWIAAIAAVMSAPSTQIIEENEALQRTTACKMPGASMERRMLRVDDLEAYPRALG